MKPDCFIVEDLLPLYDEDLLQEETKIWVETHLKSCDSCANLVDLSERPIEEETITSPIDYEKMMSKINFKLSIYQIIFVALSFFIAMKTSAPAGSFGFILTYAILGFLTFLFYKNLKITIAISFLPIFFWLLGPMLSDFQTEAEFLSMSKIKYFFTITWGALLFAGIHSIFALLGAAIGALTLKLRENEE